MNIPNNDQDNSESVVAGNPEYSEPMEMDEDNIGASENEEEDTSDDNEVLNQEMSEILDNIKTLSKENINDPGIYKGTKNFIKMFKKHTGSLQSFSKLLNSIGHEVTARKQSGKKRTGGSLIPVQKNSKSCRVFKHRGNGASTYGRKPVDKEKRVEFLITEDTDDCFQSHTLPKQKHSKKRQKHSLKQAVEQNIPLAKKH